MTDKPGKIVVVGLDGATFDLIKPWAAEGHLPVLQRIMHEGAYGSVEQHGAANDCTGLDLICHRRKSWQTSALRLDRARTGQLSFHTGNSTGWHGADIVYDAQRLRPSRCRPQYSHDLSAARGKWRYGIRHAHTEHRCHLYLP